MTDADLAKYLARWVFEIGNGFHATPVQRLQFMHGKYPGHEVAGVGLCEGALADQLASALRSYREKQGAKP